MSQRRSARARTTQPPPSGPAHSTSSSSTSSTRAERSTRSHHKQQSPRKSTSPQSLSSEELDDPAPNGQAEPPLTRRRTREHDNDEDEDPRLEDDLDDEIAEEEEITRCVCGHLEYPGPPSDTGKSKDGQLPSSLTGSDLQTDEAGGLFIQCDICKVWQHGGCVGIMEEAASPEEYFCEECRKDLHKLMTSSKGQKYSRYLPVYELQAPKTAHRKPSVPKESENKTPKDRDKVSRASVDAFTKRRSTMNSRAAYDEDEVLRKVIEESKTEGGITNTDNGSKKNKRSRDESEEIKQEPKRQRTGSRSPASSPTLESDDEAQQSKNGTINGKPKPRGAALQSHREKELREREKEREREKQAAANRRKERAGRRRADDSDLPEPSEAAAEDAPPQPETVEPQPPDTPVPTPLPTVSHKKSGRPTQRRGRLGKNQYTREQNNHSASPHRNHDNSPLSPASHIANGHDSTGNGSDGTISKQSKARFSRLEKTSWNEIRRPAGIMQNYITQKQIEMAGEKTTVAAAATVQTLAVVANEKSIAKTEGGSMDDDLEKFKTMSTLEMMDYLSRDLVLWQKMHGAA